MMLGSHDPFGFGGSLFSDPLFVIGRRWNKTDRQQMVEVESRHDRWQCSQEEERERESQEKEREHMEQLERRRQEQSASYPPGTIERGPDDKFLYRDVAPSTRSESGDITDVQSNSSSYTNPSSVSHEDKENETAGTSTKKEVFDSATEEATKSGCSSSSNEEWPDHKDVNDDLQMKYQEAHDDHVYESTGIYTASLPVQKRPKIIVENVPNEEDKELRELQSVWRNRVPSPGEWMEPVESFCG